ncbi:CdaR family transcriptional regulator [Nocardioides sp. Arc9.136]|uniref:PucR family transcriptional regulator n=1 Tax=Nocardioides sp. Arc9.136 TaxID=2996826 RepID=UPI0026669193|nr:helix-turn-helix domain-containing protein [Nocardioides sp. Arc9.136]WKN47177.1 helix-turn-helix domain-containing protein [Nocardioides sp. Arc9.136]
MSSIPAAVPRSRAADALQRATGALSTAATARMDAEMPWFRDLSAQDRSWVGLIVQAGIRGFVDWFRADDGTPAPGANELAASVFGAAPRALAGVINLQQTVDLVRLSIEVVESDIDRLLGAEDVPLVRAAVLRYAREVAFATAEVYARAAEVRGAWDARLEALVVDAVLRAEADEAVLSRASALGWSAAGDVAVVLGAVPERTAAADLPEEVRRAARTAGLEALCAVQGDRLVVLLGGVADPRVAAESVVGLFGEGPVVVGPAADDLAGAHVSARAAVSAHRAAAGWPGAPRPVQSIELLPERALAGDGHARRHLVEQLYLPLLRARGTMVETLATYLDEGSSIEGTARALFVHPNTVRYRLRQVTDTTGFSPSRPRDAFVLRIALVLGRQSGRVE